MQDLPVGFADIKTCLLKKADWNYKRDDEYLKSKLISNFEKNGQIENIIVRDLLDGTYEIVNGNHRYDVMVELSIDECHVYNLGVISKEHAMRIAIETNETRFATDHEKLSMTIDALLNEYDISDLSETLPWSEEEIEAMQSGLDDIDEEVSEEVGDTSSNDDSRVVYIISVDVVDDMIQDELQEICDRYDSAVMRVK